MLFGPWKVNRVNRLFTLVFLLTLLASCRQAPQVTNPTIDDGSLPVFTDTHVDGARVQTAIRVDEVIGTQESDISLGTELPALPSRGGVFEPQAVLAGASGYVYYIQYNPNSTIDPYRVYRFDQYNDIRALVYGGKREVQAVAGSYDGNFIVLSMRQTTTTPNDFEIFRFNILGQFAQRLTNNQVDDTNVSMSGNALSIVWEAPVSGVAKIFFRKYTDTSTTTAYTESVLVSSDSQRQPSLSANGKYLALVRDLASGKDQVFRYDLSSNIYAGFSTQSIIPLEHPSISNTGKQVAWLQNDVLDQVILRNTAVNTIQTVVGPLDTIEHPFISADGQLLTYGRVEASTLKAFTRNLFGAELRITNPVAPISNKGMMWQIPFVNFSKIVPSDGAAEDGFGWVTATDDDFIVAASMRDDYDVDENGTVENNVGSAYLLRREGSNWAIVKKLTPYDGLSNHGFGWSVAIAGDTVIIGAIGEAHDTNGDGVAEPRVGAAYIFQRNQGGTDNWGEVTKLVASDGKAEDEFGRSVVISGDTVIVGAPWKDFDANSDGIIDCNSISRECNRGSAYVFQRNQGGTDSWGEVSQLSSSEGKLFGLSVALAGDTVVIGSYAENRDIHGDGTVEYGVGAAYIFERDLGGTNVWGQRTKLVASDAEENEGFGNSVAISGDTVVIGAYGEDHFPDNNQNGGCWYLEEDRLEDGCDVGAAYVYERHHGGSNHWGEVKKLIAKDDFQGAAFGVAVATSGDLVFVSSTSIIGGVYIFQRSLFGREVWSEMKKLVPPVSTSQDLFGNNIAVDTVISVGALNDTNGKGKWAGALYIYEQ